MSLRAAFPVLEHVVYLNAGTCGPVPAAARTALQAALDRVDAEGRQMAYYEATFEAHAALREAYARAIGAQARDVALTTSTSEGIARVVAGLDLRAGDEILTSDAEHPGLLGPLLAARKRLGIAIRAVPLADIPGEVGPRTRLVACSHVGWLRGDVVPALDAVDPDVPVLLDGAQGAGAIAVDVERLGCAFYAASGQKWLCGPVGTGLLHVAPAWQERLAPTGPSYVSYVAPAGPADAWELHEGARRHDTPALGLEQAAAALAAIGVLEEHGWEAVHAEGPSGAARLAALLRDAGREVNARADTTLLSWVEDDPPATLERLAAARVSVRPLPDTPYLRASVGAWNSEADLERLVDALAC